MKNLQEDLLQDDITCMYLVCIISFREGLIHLIGNKIFFHGTELFSVPSVLFFPKKSINDLDENDCFWKKVQNLQKRCIVAAYEKTISSGSEM